MVDISIALEYLVLTAHEFGLGTCPIGLIVTAKVEVIDLIADKNRVKFKTTCTNQNGKVVADGIAWVMPAKKE